MKSENVAADIEGPILSAPAPPDKFSDDSELDDGLTAAPRSHARRPQPITLGNNIDR